MISLCPPPPPQTHTLNHTQAWFLSPTHTTTNLPKNINSSLFLPLCSGGPGSGKGTQSLKIAERYGFQYMSVGELLRKKMIHNATSNRKWSLIAKIITNGELAPQVAEKQRQRRVGRGGGWDGLNILGEISGMSRHSGQVVITAWKQRGTNWQKAHDKHAGERGCLSVLLASIFLR